MDCAKAHPRIGAWLDGRPEPDVEKHVRECAACSREAEYLRTLKREVRNLPTSEAPASLRAAVERRIGAGRPAPGTWRWMSAAAAAAVLVGIMTLALPSTALPDIVVRSSAFHDELVAGRASFLDGPVLAPRLIDAEKVGVRQCDLLESISPSVVYKGPDGLISFLTLKTKLPPLPESARRTIRDRTYYQFRCDSNTVLLCSSEGVTHVWISRMPEQRVIRSCLAAPRRDSSLHAARIGIRGPT